MLFLPPEIYDARATLLKQFKDGQFDADGVQALLDLDPHDHLAMLALGRLRKDAGRVPEAIEYFWRAIHSHPTVIMPYLELGLLYFDEPESEALAFGLVELGLNWQAIHSADELTEPDEVPRPDDASSTLKGEALEEFLRLPVDIRRQAFIDAIRERRTSEPVEVTAQLRGFRLLQELIENEALEAPLVDSIVDEGEAIVPLLRGVVRDWAQDYLKDDGDAAIENSLALLGETATAAEIPLLLEFVDLESENASGASKWALARILERHPDEAVRLLSSIAPQLGPNKRLAIVDLILRRLTLDPAGELHFRLSENLEGMDAESRNAFFPLLLSSLALARGPLGVTLGRQALNQQRGRLSKTVWRECDELLKAAREGGVPALPLEPWPYSVYDICAGEAIWDEDGDEDDEEEMLPPPVPEPVRRVAVPGRNDPCWCGSGKKYKKCHLNDDESGRRPPPANLDLAAMNEFAALRKRIGAFPGEVLPARELKQASQEFYGDEPGDAMMLLDWVLHDWIAPSLGRTLMEEFLSRSRTRLTARERPFVEAWAQSYVGLYETQEVTPGIGLQLKDLHSGEAMFVHDVNLSKRLVRWDVIFARLVPGERGTEVTGAGLSVQRTVVGALRDWMEESRREAGLNWPEFLKRNWPRIRRQSFEAGTEWAESLRIVNSSGEELLISKAVYRLRDGPGVLAALRSSPELRAEGDGFVWLDEHRTHLGQIRIAGRQLTLECNSKERLSLGAQLLSHLTGPLLEHVRDEFTSQAEIRRRAREAPEPRRVENPIPKEERDA